MYTIFSVGDSEDIPQEIRAIRSLLANIAARAIMDYLGSNRKYVRPAERWLFTSKRTDEWSFVWICDIIGWDIEQVRRNITQQQNEQKETATESLRRLNRCKRVRLVRRFKTETPVP